jgi:homoserine O-acetyltransferase/O-succinyltransferase
VSDLQIFSAGDIELQSGEILHEAFLAYTTYGRLNDARDNAIIYPTYYMGTHAENEWLIGPGRPLSPGRYFIIVPNMVGNGVSSSPSNMPPLYGGPRFPLVTIYDNVRLQHRLLTEQLGVKRLQLAVGYSMGGQQAYHWGAMYPEMVDRIACICGSARTSRHNFVFLEGPKAALCAAEDFRAGNYVTPPTKGLRAFARVWAGWAWSRAFFRERLDQSLTGLATPEAFIAATMEAGVQSKDANDLLAMLATWQSSDISANPKFSGDLVRALSAIAAKALIMPCRTDLYFPPEDNEFEVAHMSRAELRIIPSVWGHMAGSSFSPDGSEFVRDALTNFLGS